MNTEIINLISKLNSEDIIDTHTIINYFLNGERHLKNLYMNEYKDKGYSDIRDFHAYISKMIKDTGFVKCIGEIKSFNINDNLSSNKLWKKL